MSVLDAVPVPGGWTLRRFDRCFTRSQQAGRPDFEPLSVYLGAGVVPRASRADNHNELGADMRRYLVVEPGDLVFNKLRTWQGGFGRSKHQGIVSPAYFVCRPVDDVSPRFIDHLLHSAPYLAELVRISKWQPPSQFDTPWEQLRLLPLMLPPYWQQRHIADFLDRECERMSGLSNTVDRLADATLGPAMELAKREFDEQCLGRIGYRFGVQLGKKLYEDRIDHDTAVPYLRNANVHWDQLRLDDLKVMNFDAREREMYSLKRGDLLVCEGGEPGRSAVWEEELSECFFQMALNRVRPYADDSTRYLMWALRVLSDRDAFAVDGPGRYTHLTAEMLRAVRVPMPSAAIQHERLAEIDAAASRGRRLAGVATRIRIRLAQYREALITEAVTGQLDLSAVSDSQMNERAHAAAEGAVADHRTAAQVG